MKFRIQQQSFGLILIVIVSFILYSCKNDKGKNIPDVSHISGAPDWVEADLQLFGPNALKTNSISDFEIKHPTFYRLLIEQILQLGEDPSKPTETSSDAFLKFSQDERIVWLQDTTRTILGNLSDLKDDFEQSFKFYQYYFPEKDLPRIYTLLTEFSYLPFIFQDDDGRDGLGISLEMFLGEDFPYRETLGNLPSFSAYLTRSYNKEHLVMRTMEVLLDDVAGQRPGGRLLDYMIHQGKIKYCLANVLPTEHDSIIMALSGKDIDWLNSNERNIWAHFLHNELLYETDSREINKLINPSPNAPGMPPDAPGNVGTWMGWQIVKQFMRRNPEMAMGKMLKLDDAQAFLESAKYKPPRE